MSSSREYVFFPLFLSITFHLWCQFVVFTKQTHDTKDGATLIQCCWPASEKLYELFD